MAAWDGALLLPIGGGLNGDVNALVEFDDGTGPALYAGGGFSIGGYQQRGVARWDGGTWSIVGGGMDLTVYALAVHDDGTGPVLYAGGNFTNAGGTAANGVARWDGTSWAPLGTGAWGTVRTLESFDDGSGLALYAGGALVSAGGAGVAGIARWDGTGWSSFGSWFDGGPGLGGVGDLYAFEIVDLGAGPVLVAGGTFDVATASPAKHLAAWNGASWSPLGDGVLGGGVRALAAFEQDGHTSLVAGGAFTSAAGGEDSHLARYGCAAPGIDTVPGCFGNTAQLSSSATDAPLGSVLPLQVSAAQAQSGLAIVFFGSAGIDTLGCGTLLPGLGESLLAPLPTPLVADSAVLAGGAATLGPLIPAFPGLQGYVAHLQAAAVDAGAAQPVELSNALTVVLGG